MAAQHGLEILDEGLAADHAARPLVAAQRLNPKSEKSGLLIQNGIVRGAQATELVL